MLSFVKKKKKNKRINKNITTKQQNGMDITIPIHTFSRALSTEHRYNMVIKSCLV